MRTAPGRSALAVLAILVALVLACRAPRAATSDLPRKVTAVMLPFLTFAPLIIADERGFFRRHGLEVEWVRLQRSPESLPALTDGRIDVGAGGLSAGLANVVARGAPIRIVANKGTIPESGCTAALSMVGRRGVGPLPGSLRGARVSVQPMLFNEMFLDRLLDRNGVARDAVHRVDLPAGAIHEALQKGLVDFAVTSEPRVAQGRAQGTIGPVVEGAEALPGFDHGFILFGPNLLTRDPEAGRRFLMAYLEGTRAYQEGKTPENVRALARATGVEEPLLEATCWMPVREGLAVDLDSIRQFLDWTRERGALEGSVSAEQLVDLAPLRAAAAALGPAARAAR